MTLDKRRKIFYGLVVLFLVLGTGVVLYAQGWRFDFSTLKITKVGAIFVRSFPADAQIYLDGKNIPNKSGLFGDGTLISGLLPKNYSLKLTEADYKSWSEDAAVVPTLITNLKYAVLIPASSTPAATGTVSDFGLFGSELATKDKNGVWRLGGARLGLGEITGETNDLNYFLLLNTRTNAYSLRNLAAGTTFSINSALGSNNIGLKSVSTVTLDPTNGKSLAIATTKGIYNLDAGISQIATISKSAAGLNFGKNVAVSQFFWAWTEYNPQSNTSTLVIYDKFLENIRTAATELEGPNSSLKWADNNHLAVRQNDGELYIYDILADSLTKIADDVRDFAFSPDGARLVTLESRSVEIFALDNTKNYYRFNLPDVGNIKSLTWYHDDNHLFIAYPDRVAFLDLADTTIRNFTTVASTPHAEYDTANNTFYFLDGGLVKKLEFPK